MVNSAKLRIPDQGLAATSASDFLNRLPVDLQFNLGLTNADERTRRRAQANLRLAINRLCGRDQQVILTALGMTSGSDGPPLAVARAIPPQTRLQDRYRLHRSARAFDRLAQVILEGPEHTAGPVPRRQEATLVAHSYDLAS